MSDILTKIYYRPAQASDIEKMTEFIFDHGTNPWNYLPRAGVAKHLQAISTNETFGIIAELNSEMIGFLTYNIGNFFPQYEQEETRHIPRGYVAEVVVSKDYAGNGIGTELLKRAQQLLQEKGARTIYIDRHEENVASAGMMRKARFVEVDTFSDLDRRFVGSRKTTVLRFQF